MKHVEILFMAVLMGVAPVSQAATAFVQGSVVRTLIADQDQWGGCMVALDKALTDFGLDCPSGAGFSWVSFSCSGTFTTKDIAYRMLDSAQMAFALGKPVTVLVDDTKKHNGFCYASRIYVVE